jgi:ABC-type transport system substrate-binding protein
MIAETSFDPAFASDAASDAVIANIFESMLDYDYLVRPVKLVPRTLEAMPVVQDDGKTYTMKVRKGIYFTPDPAFKGKPRELTAADHAYALKRFLDPAVKSPWMWLFEASWSAAMRRTPTRPRPASSTTTRRWPDSKWSTATRSGSSSPNRTCAFSTCSPSRTPARWRREVVEAYGNDIGAHPVGTGPYVLGRYKRSSQIELVANPDYREVTYAPSGPVPAASQPVAAALKGKRLPRNARVDIRIIEEGQAQWLAFANREVDLLEILPAEFTPQALTDGKLKPELAARGIVHQLLIRPNVAFTYFNMEDSLVGGYTPEKIALRRAISMGYNLDEAIRVLYYGRAHPASGPIPPDISGYDPTLKTGAQFYDPAAARALLDKYGYKDRDGDRFRELPDGKPLTLERWSSPSSASRQADELWKKNMNAIGLKIEFKTDKLPEMRKLARQGKIPMRGDGWNADYPDAENFMQLLYGPNVGQANYSRFNLPEFNKLYDEARRLPDSPQRTKLFSRMTELVVAYAPWRVTINDLEDTFAHPWAHNYVPHPIRSQTWMFIDVDDAARAKAR